MTDEERQRTMHFILEQMAQLAASAQRNEEEHAQFTESFKQLNKSVSQLSRIAAGMARRYRRDHDDLRDRISALIDAQMRSEEWQARAEEWQARAEESQARTEEWQARMEKSFARSDARMTRLEEEAERNSAAIAKLAASSDRNRDDIAALARVVSDLAGRRNGGDS